MDASGRSFLTSAQLSILIEGVDWRAGATLAIDNGRLKLRLILG